MPPKRQETKLIARQGFVGSGLGFSVLSADTFDD
jgi:hypothetical protein